MENNGGIPSAVASWVGSTVSSAFFSSLERFSCVNISTSDPEIDDDDDYSSTTTTPTAASISPTATTTTPTATTIATTTTTSPSAAQVNGHNTIDVANLPV